MDRVTGVHLYVWDSSDGADIQSRMFAPRYGVPEDPATGSANVALIGLLAHLHPAANLRLTKTIRQGIEMGRPSRLMASADKSAGRVTATQIGGTCVPMMRAYSNSGSTGLMSALGPKRTFPYVAFDVAFGGKADMSWCSAHVCF
jgi:PhzF family phenazine biosynthesis protein